MRKPYKMRAGFTVAELLVSLAILTMISVTTAVSLRSTRQKEELTTAARVLISEIRNVQAQALAARNVLTCSFDADRRRVCEAGSPSLALCLGPCEQTPPPHLGVFLETAHDAITIFADVADQDWRYGGNEEWLAGRSLNPLGGARVVISQIKVDQASQPMANLAVGRQSGTVRLEACGDIGLPVCAPTEPKMLELTLRHQDSGATATVEVNAVTGRVSVNGI